MLVIRVLRKPACGCDMTQNAMSQVVIFGTICFE